MPYHDIWVFDQLLDDVTGCDRADLDLALAAIGKPRRSTDDAPVEANMVEAMEAEMRLPRGRLAGYVVEKTDRTRADGRGTNVVEWLIRPAVVPRAFALGRISPVKVETWRT